MRPWPRARHLRSPAIQVRLLSRPGCCSTISTNLFCLIVLHNLIATRRRQVAVPISVRAGLPGQAAAPTVGSATAAAAPAAVLTPTSHSSSSLCALKLSAPRRACLWGERLAAGSRAHTVVQLYCSSDTAFSSQSSGKAGAVARGRWTGNQLRLQRLSRAGRGCPMRRSHAAPACSARTRRWS